METLAHQPLPSFWTQCQRYKLLKRAHAGASQRYLWKDLRWVVNSIWIICPAHKPSFPPTGWTQGVHADSASLPPWPQLSQLWADMSSAADTTNWLSQPSFHPCSTGKVGKHIKTHMLRLPCSYILFVNWVPLLGATWSGSRSELDPLPFLAFLQQSSYPLFSCLDVERQKLLHWKALHRSLKARSSSGEWLIC